MKNSPLILITIAYIFFSVVFNYGLFQLLIINKSNDQYFLIFIYFLSEALSFLFLLLPKSFTSTLGPVLVNRNTIDVSEISVTDNNASNNITNNMSVSQISLNQPYVGMKCISFLIPSIFDFLSKFFIFNGLKMIGNEIILRTIIQLCMILFWSKIVLKSIFVTFSITGVLIILFGLIFSCFYYHISQTVKLYFNSDKNNIIGMLLCFIGEIFGSIQIFVQMKFFKIGELLIFREMAWEGLFGLIISFIFFFISLLIPCTKIDNEKNEEIYQKMLFCYPDSLHIPIISLLHNIIDNIVWNVVFFLICVFYNLIGTTLAKYIGEVYRVSTDAARISIILQLILFIHTKNIKYIDVIFSFSFTLIILLGVALSIKLRKQKGMTFGQIPFDKSFSLDLSVGGDKSYYINDSNIEL
jgi:hypothetical protein